MAKKKRRQSASASKSAGEPANVRKAVRELRERYTLGQKVLKETPGEGYALGVTDRMATELGVSRDFIDKARQFASSYTQKQFEDLCELRRPDGMPLGTSLIVPLLKVKDKRERGRLQRQAAKEGWGKRRLEQEVAGIPSDQPSSGGRRPAKAFTVEQALVQIVQRAEQWSRWAGGFEGDQEGDDTVSLADLPEVVRKRLLAVSREIKELRKAAELELEPERETRKKK